MPATFPAHPAAVLPLKLWRPSWFDGAALAVGSMAPDLAYALDGSRLERPAPSVVPLWQIAHSLPWFILWAVPVTLALCRLLRFAAPRSPPISPSRFLICPHLWPALTGPPRPLATRAPPTGLLATRLPLADTLSAFGHRSAGPPASSDLSVTPPPPSAADHVGMSRFPPPLSGV